MRAVTPAVNLLVELDISHELVSYEHDPAAESYGNEAAEVLGLDPDSVFKTLLVDVAGGERDGELAVAVVPVSGMLDLKAMAKALGAKRTTMADAAAAERSSGYVVGGISPLGQRTPLLIVVDELVEALDQVHVSGGKRGLEIRLSPADLIAATNAVVAPIGT